MKIDKHFKKSFVLTAALPSTSDNIELFEKAVSVLKGKGYDTVEFFVDKSIAHWTGEVLKKYEMGAVFLAAGYQKKNRLSLCAVDEESRKFAISETKKCIESAIACGAERVLITSGVYPGESFEQLSWENLGISLAELRKYAPGIGLTMEPGDREIDSLQLAGPTDETVSWVRQYRKNISNLMLTMDTSHIAQLGEDVPGSLFKSREVCNHIHIANCILKLGHPLYGDKHPMFNDKDAVFTLESLKTFAHEAERMHGENVTISIEIINRLDNEWEGFESILEEEKWF